jgi:hypothetical protein
MLVEFTVTCMQFLRDRVQEMEKQLEAERSARMAFEQDLERMVARAQSLYSVDNAPRSPTSSSRRTVSALRIK